MFQKISYEKWRQSCNGSNPPAVILRHIYYYYIFMRHVFFLMKFWPYLLFRCILFCSNTVLVTFQITNLCNIFFQFFTSLIKNVHSQSLIYIFRMYGPHITCWIFVLRRSLFLVLTFQMFFVRFQCRQLVCCTSPNNDSVFY